MTLLLTGIACFTAGLLVGVILMACLFVAKREDEMERRFGQ